MNKIITFLTAILPLFVLNLNAQTTVTFTGGGSDVIPCGVENDFFDGFGGAYGDNLDQTYTVCVTPGQGFAVEFIFDASYNSGYFDIDPSDTLFVYDGPDVNSPLIAALNNNTSPNMGATGITTLNNATGCITFQFVTDGANGGQGFQGVIRCRYICQPVEPYITATPPIVPEDTGTIDICLGDTVWLSANANFPMSAANGGIGYNQTLENSLIEWQVAGGLPMQPAGDSMYIVPDQIAGYYVDLVITDTLGCFDYQRTRVRVGTIPTYAEMASVLDDTICYGETAIVLGGINTILEDTSGVDPTSGEYLVGGLFAEQLELPDGTGSIEDIYSTTISITGAAPTDSISAGSQLVNICVEMEHTFLGDLEMWLTCPGSQDSIVIFNAYNGNSNAPGFVPGGFSPGGIDLGIPSTGTGIGTCFQYCFSITENNLGTFASEYGSMGTTMAAGTYLPEESFDNLIGCPINGDWTLNVVDNWAIDDGWICQWNIELVDSLSPEPEYYTPQIVNGWWDNSPGLVVLGDTAIEVTPPTPGEHFYTFNIEDNFGCQHDTTVSITMIPPLTSFTQADTSCGLQLDLTAADYNIVGEWSYEAPVGETVSFSPDEFSYTPTVTLSGPGDYKFIYESDYCGQKDSAVVTILPEPQPVTLLDQTVCPGATLNFDAENENIGATYNWTPGDSTQQVFVLDSVVEATAVEVTITNVCGTASGSAMVTVETLSVTGPTDELCVADVADLDVQFSTTGGIWTFVGPSGANASFDADATDPSPEVSVTQDGEFWFYFTDDDCGMVDSANAVFVSAPTVNATIDTNRICVEDSVLLTYTTNMTELDDYVFSWEPFGISDSTLMIIGSNPDSLGFSMLDTSFHVMATVSNFCGSDSKEIIYKVIDCTLEMPTVFNPDAQFAENRYFKIVALELHPGNNVKIFDRWGRKCYDVGDYHLNPWDGGKQSDGVYFYTIERPGYEPETGYVHLVRGSGQ